MKSLVPLGIVCHWLDPDSVTRPWDGLLKDPKQTLAAPESVMSR